MTRSVVNQPKRRLRSTASAWGTPCNSAALTRRQAGAVPNGRGRGPGAIGMPRRRKGRRGGDDPPAGEARAPESFFRPGGAVITGGTPQLAPERGPRGGKPGSEV